MGKHDKGQRAELIENGLGLTCAHVNSTLSKLALKYEGKNQFTGFKTLIEWGKLSEFIMFFCPISRVEEGGSLLRGEFAWNEFECAGLNLMPLKTSVIVHGRNILHKIRSLFSDQLCSHLNRHM